MTPLRSLRFLLFPSFLSLLFAASAALPVADLRRDTPVDFAREILPLLRQNCLACHNQTKAKGGLNLESPALMLKGGDSGPGLAPGDGAASLLFRAAAHQAQDLEMPPPGNTANAVNLTADELGLLRLWIDRGARGGPPAEAPVTWQPLPSAWQPILAVAVTPDGRIAAAGRGAQVQLVHLPSGAAWGALSDPDLPHGAAHRDAVQSVAFSPDGVWLATGGFREAKLWRLWRPEALSWPVAPGPVTAAAFSPDETTAALGGEGFLELRRTTDGAPIKRLPAPAAPLRALRWSPDGERLAGVSAQGGLLLWSPGAGTLDAKADPGFRATGVTWHSDSLTLAVAAGTDGRVRFFQAGRDGFSEGPPPNLLTGLPSLAPSAPAVASRDPWAGTALWSATNAQRRARADAAWQTTAQKQAAERLPKAQAAAAKAREAFAAAEKEAAEKIAAQEQKAQARAEAEKAAAQTGAPPAVAEKLKAARDEETRAEDARVRAVARRDSAAREVGLTARQLEQAKAAEQEALQQNAAATQAVAAAELAVTTASAATNAPAPRRVAEFPCGRGWLARDDAGRFSLWTTNGHALPPGWCVVRGDVLAVGRDALLLRDKLASVSRVPLAWPEWRLARRLGSAEDARTFPDRVLAVAFSPDGRLLATGGGEPSRSGSIELWEVETGRLLARAPNLHSDTVTALAFSPDGRLLASGGADRFARLSDAATLAPVRNLEGHTGHVLA
ncbi:MAG: c-type cytochrome domain-containing protein, partial [Limisphaerales bacterium]